MAIFAPAESLPSPATLSQKYTNLCNISVHNASRVKIKKAFLGLDVDALLAHLSHLLLFCSWGK